MGRLLAGAARCCIDATEDMYPMTSHFGTLDAVYGPCWCRALALSDGENQIIFLVYELSDMPTIPDLWGVIAGGAGIRKEDLVIAVTHNHTSPNDQKIGGNAEELALGERYKEIERRAGIMAVRQAVSSLRPARIGFGETRSFVNVNRNYESCGGMWIEAPDYEGFSDKTLALVKIEDTDGRVIAVMLNHGTHAACAFNEKDTDGKVKSCGNFPGIACTFLEEYYGGGAVAIWTSGAAGDQGPVMGGELVWEYPDGYCTRIALPDGAGYRQMEYLGRRHGADALRGLRGIDATVEEVTISHRRTILQLPAQKHADPSLHGTFRMGGRGPRTDWNPMVLPALPEMVPDPGHTVEMGLELVRIGELEILCFGGEPYSEFAVYMKELLPSRQKFVMTQTWYHTGYIVPQGAAHQKTFQAFAKVLPGGSDSLIEEAIRELAGT